MRLLAISPYPTASPSCVSRYYPIFHELSKLGTEISIIFPFGSTSDIPKPYKGSFDAYFLDARASGKGQTATFGGSPALLRRSGAGMYDLSQKFLRRFFFMTELADLRMAIRGSILARRLDFDAILVMGPGTRSVIPGLLARPKRKAALILDIEDYTISCDNPLVRIFDGITVSTSTLGRAFKKYNPFYFPHTSDLLAYAKSPGENQKTMPPELIWPGIVYDYLLPAFGRLLDALRETKLPSKLTIVGGGDQESILELARKHGMLEQTSVEGWLPRKELALRLGRASIGIICPSQGKADIFRYPAKLNDYMAVGLPVICHNKGEAASAVLQSNCGFVVDFEDEIGLRRTITGLLKDGNLRAQLSANGRNYLVKNRSLDVWATKFNDYLSSKARDHGAHR